MKQRMIDYYMDVAERTAQLSYAQKLKVGAVLVKNDNIISFSWNGTPRGWDNVCENKIFVTEEDSSNLEFYQLYEKYPYKEKSNIITDEWKRYYLKTKSCVTHAEEAMLMKISSSHESSEGASLFCTHSCCMNCAKLIYGAKIKEFYYKKEYRSSDGIEFLKKCKINVIKLG